MHNDCELKEVRSVEKVFISHQLIHYHNYHQFDERRVCSVVNNISASSSFMLGSWDFEISLMLN